MRRPCLLTLTFTLFQLGVCGCVPKRDPLCCRLTVTSRLFAFCAAALAGCCREVSFRRCMEAAILLWLAACSLQYRD